MSQQSYVTHRSILLSNIENMLENIVARRQHNSNASQDLFGDTDDSNLLNIQLKPDTLKLSQLEIAQKEKESLGVYMHGNPLSEYEELIKLLNAIIKGRSLYLVIVQKIRKVFTRANTLMYALELTTIEGDLEGVIYAKNASSYSSILEEKLLYWVTGNINDPAKKQADKLAKEAKEASQNPEIDSGIDPDNLTSEQLETPIEYVESPKLVIDHLGLYSSGIDQFLNGITTRTPEKPILEWAKLIDWTQNPKTITRQILDITPSELLKVKATKYPAKSKTNYQAEYQPIPESSDSIIIPSDYTESEVNYTPDIEDNYAGSTYQSVEVVFRATSNPVNIKHTKHLLQKQDPANPIDYYRVNLSVDKAGVIQRAKNDFYIMRRDFEALGAEFKTA
ncbi:MAG: hypothetical protein H7230_04425 [Candidatus Parcubacteria bacterium]|nr:hypothetical protein [Candidatus Paceibacterota bacterium]